MRHAAVAEWLTRCESSHERRFSLALLVEPDFSFRADADRFVDENGVVLVQKHRIGRYSADFAFLSACLLIEIDAHPLHDVSADQVKHDRERDRRLLALGWRTVRFSGDEVVADALRCAREAYAMARNAVPWAPIVRQLSLIG